MKPNDLRPGLTVSGHLLSEELGEGGFARVFRVETAGAPVALKVAPDPSFAPALRAEAAALRRLEGPHFVRVLDERADGDPPSLVLELYPQGDLRRLLARHGRLAPGHALAITEHLLEGVARAHEAGIVHGDLKPENILIDDEGRPRIGDLGLSRDARAAELEHALAVAPSLETRAERVRGTLDYLAPEVRAGGEATPSSDVYALGVIVHELLVGERPAGLFELPGARLAEEGVRVPAGLDRVVARALEPHPVWRPLDARALQEELRSETSLARPEARRWTVADLNAAVEAERVEAQRLALEWNLASVACPLVLGLAGAGWYEATAIAALIALVLWLDVARAFRPS